MKCSNVDRECEWEGTVGTLEEHVATCEFTLLPCPNKCKDDKDEIAHLMRKGLEKHLETQCPQRDSKCEQCGEITTFVDIATQLHDKTCKKKILPCPNTDCTETMPREDRKRHLEKCGYAEVPCKYQRLGCEVSMLRKDMSAHEENEDNLHLHMAFDNGITIEDVQGLIAAASKNTQTLYVYVYKLMGFQRHHIFQSPLFYTGPHGYCMMIEVVCCDTNLRISVFLMKGKYDDYLKWPFIGKVTCKLLNQLEDNNHIIEQKHVNMRRRHPWHAYGCIMWSSLFTYSELAHDPVKNTHYFKDDTLYISVSMDIPDHKPWLVTTVKN